MHSSPRGEGSALFTMTMRPTKSFLTLRPKYSHHLPLTMCSAAQGNEMKIQKVFEAFEQFHLGEETLAQLVTQLEASLMQVNFWFSGIKGRRWWKRYLGIDGLGSLVSFLLKRAYIVLS